MVDLISSFENFLKKKNPNVCLTCWGVGRLEGKGRWVQSISIECPTCKGKGGIPQLPKQL